MKNSSKISAVPTADVTAPPTANVTASGKPKKVRLNRNELVLPFTQKNTEHLNRVGYFCRTGLIILCCLGYAIFFSAAVFVLDGHSTVDSSVILLPAVLFPILFAVMGLSKKIKAIVYGIAALALLIREYGIFADVSGASFGDRIMDYLVNLAQRVAMIAGAMVNAVVGKMQEMGYKGLNGLKADMTNYLHQYHVTERDMRELGFVIGMFVIAAVISACVQKKVHLIPLCLIGGGILAPFLYYGMNGSAGFSVILAAFCGMIALDGWDGIYGSKKNITRYADVIPEDKTADKKTVRREIREICRKNTAMGGFMGLAMAVLLLPVMLFATADKNMKDIPAVSTPLLKIENFITALSRGQNPDLSGLVFSGASGIDSRSTTATARHYTGQPMFTLSLGVSVPVYLRGWTAYRYNETEDCWESASYETIHSYRETFGEGFSPELLQSELLWCADQNLVELPETAAYRDHTKYGYVTAKVNIRKERPTTNLVYMPSYTSQSYGLLRYKENVPANVRYKNYFDGLFTSTSYLFLDDYSVVANLPLLRNPDFDENIAQFSDNIENQLFSIKAIYYFAKQVEVGDDTYTLQAVYHTLYPNSEDDKDSLVYRYCFTMTDEERKRVDAVIANLSAYEEWVQNNYTAVENPQIYRELAYSMIYGDNLRIADVFVYNSSEFPVNRYYGDVHGIVMNIVKWLSENTTYTLTPREPSADRPYTNAAETFLFDTREGYCVQYATAAVMLLRSVGIPARYAEGYIASDFVRNSQADSIDRYSCTIRDYNAHAWVEVWISGYGWVTYEVTTPYVKAMYTTESGTSTSGYHSGGSDITEDPEDTTDDSGITPIDDETEFSPIAVAMTVTVGIAAVIVTVVWIMQRRYRKSVTARETLLAAARSADSQETPETCRQRLQTAAMLNERIFALLQYQSLTPKTGEQMPAFAGRVDTAVGIVSTEPMTSLVSAILAGEFATDISRGELLRLADYYAGMRSYLLSGNSRIKTAWRKYIRLL